MTRTEFEQLIPALRDVDGVPFRVCQDEMKTYIVQLKKDLLLTAPTGEDRVGELPEAVQTALERTAAVGAAAKMLPTLDLTYTPEGFAVRRNDQLTPASTERVQALRRQLYEQEARLWSELLDTIVQQGDALLPSGGRDMLVGFFCYSPVACRRLGLMPADVLPEAENGHGWTMHYFLAAKFTFVRAHNLLVRDYLGRAVNLGLIKMWYSGETDMDPEDPYKEGYEPTVAALKLMVRTAARAEASFARYDATTRPWDLDEIDAQLTRAVVAVVRESELAELTDLADSFKATPIYRHYTGTDRAFKNRKDSGMYFF
ncbi:MAG: hypothetical protein IJ092_03955 [Atopobiaceae bacterium]|nr:hypothetical protein [Atopobiaceae bacterium]